MLMAQRRTVPGPRSVVVGGHARVSTLAREIDARRMFRATGISDASPLDEDDLEYERPVTRGDCIDQARPCPWVSCKHHLYLDVNPETGSIKFIFPGRSVESLTESCSLDVADRGHHKLVEIGKILNVTRERVRQLEEMALAQLRQEPSIDGKDEEP